ncbi:PHD finger protein ALFIN-LIKE 3-like [Cucumis melo var. makuwa]|uniref:PHD finger protein ALFIN-LIKE 3-like n=1 Tax=Cucumis melo var. makuwa TaxID=1194695 RepID=A0A5D3DAL6_CUCMM|nr:PHD finger protein ALFIN-LIKE 3-like [Cucumis melo var. makuwa]TYK20605.1 PHD finger protein ALFIN-LIKE 3-like [Cucumis melo var. makuwa]
MQGKRYEEDEDEHGDTLCRACGENCASDEFWICCDIYEKWFNGKFVGHLQPNCLKCSFGFIENQFVLGVPSSSPKTSFVLDVPLDSLKIRDLPTGSLDCVVGERASLRR